MKKFDYILNLDYLQLFGVIPVRSHRADLTYELLPYGSRHFSRIEKLMLNGEYVAVLESEPRSLILKEKSCLLKIENHILYEKNCFLKIDSLIQAVGFNYLSISRLDIAVDFVNFENNLKPETLINGFLREKYLRNGRGKYMVIGEQKNVKAVEYLRFGSKSSEINTYLYNKSKEMRDVKLKQHIAESWNSLQYGDDEDVWRLEHSLKSQACNYFDKRTGEIIKLNLDVIRNNEVLLNLFASLTDKYFDFKVNDGQQNKSRMRSKVLFNFDEVSLKRVNFVTKKDITRADKVFLKRLYLFTEKNIDAGYEEQEAVDRVSAFIKRDPHMLHYYEQKRLDWDKESGEIINKTVKASINS